MPIYKISRRGQQEQREQLSYRRMRLAALLFAGALLVATAMLMLAHTGHLSL